MHSVTFPNSPDGRREWIKASLRLAGYTLGSLAREIGLSRTAASVALWKPYPRMERIIATKLGLTAEEIWPERYADGRPQRRRARRGPNDGRSMHADNASTGHGRASERGAR